MKQSTIRAVGMSLMEIYTENHIPRAAAAFSYFVTLSLFPMLIVLYTMLGGMFPATEQLRDFFNGLLPEKTADTIVEFLRYVSENLSQPMLVAALAVLVTSASGAYRTVDNVMAEMRGASRFSGLVELGFSMIFSLLFMAAVYLSAILILTGKWFLDFVDKHLMFVNISDSWRYVRFLLLFLLLFVMLGGVYRLTAPKGRTIRMLPGAFLSSVALVVVSGAFSMVIGASVRYPLVYGSLASVILMMFWLYVCGVVLFMGNGLNVALERLYDQRQHDQRQQVSSPRRVEKS